MLSVFIYLCFSIRGRVNQGRSQWQTQIKESRSTKIKSGLAHHFFALYLFSKSSLRFFYLFIPLLLAFKKFLRPRLYGYAGHLPSRDNLRERLYEKNLTQLPEPSPSVLPCSNSPKHRSRFPETYNDPNFSPYKRGLNHVSYPIPFCSRTKGQA